MDYRLSSNIANFLYAILIATVIGILCTLGIQSKNALEALVAEYSVMAAVILLLIVLIILNITQSPIGGTIFSFQSFLTLFPFFWILFIICYVIALITIYFDRIADKKVSDYYESFSTTSLMLIITQMILLVSSVLKTPIPTLDKKTFTILMFLGILNLIVVITIGVILKFYSTDC